MGEAKEPVLRHIINALIWSAAGIKTAWQNELAFRVETITIMIMMPVGIWLGRSAAERALLIASCWLAFEKKNYKFTLGPSIFLFITTIAAAIWISYGTIKHFFVTPEITTDRAIGDWLTGLIALFLVICAAVLIKDAFAAIRKFTTEKAAGKPAAVPGSSGSAK